MFDEKEILEYWKKNKVFEKSVALRQVRSKKNKKFVFFDGPPTANGKPHIGHFETRVFKDIILRYKTMRGYFVPRRAGWDTHGLPVEVEVEKKLGLKNKKDIEKYGIAEFNQKCRESVWKYKVLWEEFSERMGFWIDMAHPYITYENSYIESLWGVIKEFAKKSLLYEDYKVMPWCARCGTALSSHELAQGYEKVKEDSIYVKLKLKGEKNTYFLVWTTTPWTLPGNVALAINQKVGYIYIKKGNDIFILAETRLDVFGEGGEIVKRIKGEELIDLEYEPPYTSKAPYKVVAGGFVSTEDGTGIVHIAPAFGDDDFGLSKKYDLPVLLTTNERGLMDTDGKTWNGQWFKKADSMIIEDLKSRNFLFKKEQYEHDYPFCWRCKNPLMYLARKSWWLDVNNVRARLLENNQTINWHPEHIKDGRFGEWLKEKKNWAFSRERYWGTPLPVWRCGKCERWETIGTLGELKKRGASFGNKYFMMRHGEAETNAKNIANCSLEENYYSLTPKGRKQVVATADIMRKKRIVPDVIFTSPFLRTKETAEIVADAFTVSSENFTIDSRLMEVQVGIFSEGRPEKYHEYFKNDIEKFIKAPPEGESLTDLKRRMFAVISEIENRHTNKTILIVSHEYPLWMLWTAAEGKTNAESVEAKKKIGDDFIKTAGIQELKFHSLPRDENLIMDLHKPYIDEVKLRCVCGCEMRRVSEVCDVWFDSGAMPFASDSPGFPADYIVEAIDQTRGWFYTLLAVSTLLGKEAPYKNVISLGHVLDLKGKKMSKSLGNIVEPMALIGKYGADAARWYFFTINQPWDSKLFKEDDVKDVGRRFFVILWNVLQFWKMYGTRQSCRYLTTRPLSLIINKWVLMRFLEVSNLITQKLDTYDIVGAARDLENFVMEDVSRWYIRRIRGIMKDGRATSKETGLVLACLLGEISKLLAPFAPFMAEKIWLALANKDSVHLTDWPKSRGKTFGIKPARPACGSQKTPSVEWRGEILASMQEARRIVGLALKARQKAGIKVRQPLALLKIQNSKSKIRNNIELLNLITEEINIKNIEFDPKLEDKIWLNTIITPELKEEGIFRDLVREIQSARKTAGLKPKDKASAILELPKEILEVAQKNEKVLAKETNLKSIKFSAFFVTKILLK